jgi:16S rRNA (cytidine1402-2'-O)-methyltransferase
MNDTSSIQIRNPEESNLCSGLYLVPTPIGNLRDITLRALDVLKACDIIVCEDSRVTGKLLKSYGISSKKKIVYNDHADDAAKNRIISFIEEGKIITLVSDAGTPMISDPGYKLVRDCLAQGLYVTALPGANAVLPALQLSAMPSDKFIFAGFLPAKDKAMRDMLLNYNEAVETLIFYESPKRLSKTLRAIADIIPDRQVAVVREISKLFEESVIMAAADLADHYEDHSPKGEIAIVIHGYEKRENANDLNAEIQQLLHNGLSVKDVTAALSEKTGHKKKDIYNRAVEIKQAQSL